MIDNYGHPPDARAHQLAYEQILHQQHIQQHQSLHQHVQFMQMARARGCVQTRSTAAPELGPDYLCMVPCKQQQQQQADQAQMQFHQPRYVQPPITPALIVKQPIPSRPDPKPSQVYVQLQYAAAQQARTEAEAELVVPYCTSPDTMEPEGAKQDESEMFQSDQVYNYREELKKFGNRGAYYSTELNGPIRRGEYVCR